MGVFDSWGSLKVMLSNRNLLECPVSVRFLNDKYVSITHVGGRELHGQKIVCHIRPQFIYTSGSIPVLHILLIRLANLNSNATMQIVYIAVFQAILCLISIEPCWIYNNNLTYLNNLNLNNNKKQDIAY